MSKDKLIDAIGLIKDEYIEEAHTKRKRWEWNWSLAGKLAIAAVCLCLFVTVVPKVLFKSATGGDNYMVSDSAGSNYRSGAAPSSEKAINEEGSAYYVEDEGTSNALETLNMPDKKLIVTGDMSLETMDLDETLKSIEMSLSQYGAYIQDSSISTGGYRRNYTATIRIPAENYEEFLNSFEGTGNITYYHENTKDITDTYSDLSARVNSLKAEEERVLEFYKQASTLEELMLVEERLTDIRYEIDYLETSLKNYDLLVSYSTLYLDIAETKEYTETSVSFWTRLGNAFVNGWKNFTSGIEDFMIDVIYNIWTIILLAALAFVGYKTYKWYRNRKG